VSATKTKNAVGFKVKQVEGEKKAMAAPTAWECEDWLERLNAQLKLLTHTSELLFLYLQDEDPKSCVTKMSGNMFDGIAFFQMEFEEKAEVTVRMLFKLEKEANNND